MVSFTLKIDDDAKSLSKENGVNALDLGRLLIALISAIDPKDGTSCVVTDITDNCYAPILCSTSHVWKNNFIDLHERVLNTPIKDLKKSDATYSRVLKSVLKKGRYIEVSNEIENTFIKIYSSDIHKDIDSFYSIRWVKGTITEIGTPDDRSRNHIVISGLPYRIYISHSQDEQLRKHYEGSVIDFKVKEKKAISDERVVSAELLSFILRNNTNLSQSIAKLKGKKFTFSD